MLDFISGNTSPVKEIHQKPNNEFELQKLDEAEKETVEEHPRLNFKPYKRYYSIATLIVLVLFVIIFCLPIGFEFIMKDIDLGNASSCKKSFI